MPKIRAKPAVIAAGAVVGLVYVVGVATDDDGGSSTPTLISPPAVASPSPSPSPPADTSPAQVVETSALDKLATLPIKGRAPKTGYDRDLFGDSWTDDVTVPGGHNGCDTRNDILRRDLVAVEIKPGSNGCAVLTGTLDDPYSGSTVAFQRGADTSQLVQIDHVVALSDAWQKGAQQWDEFTRRNFANDPINLQATTASMNQQKSDGDAATWLPANKSFRCTYVSRIVDVKAAYGLWMTQAEHNAVARILTHCDETAAPPPAPPPAATPEPPVTVPPEQAGSPVYYPNCRAAKAVGAAPLYAGQPGYRIGMDGDGDGVACER